MNTLTNEAIEKLARKRAKAKMGWFIHATVYVCVNLGLLLLWSESDRPWRMMPALGWGLGLALHGLSVWFVQPGGRLLDTLTERERAKLMKKL